MAAQIQTDRGKAAFSASPSIQDFATNGYFYVNVINTSGDTEIRRYQASSSDPEP